VDRGPPAGGGALSLLLAAACVVHIAASGQVLPRVFPTVLLVLGLLVFCAVMAAWLLPGGRRTVSSRRPVSPSLPELNPNPVIEIEKGGRVTYANPAALSLFPDLPEIGFAHPCLSGLQDVVGRLSRDCRAGDRWYHQDAVADPAAPRVLRVYAFEISDRMQAESRQRESANILRNILEGSSDTIFVKDTQLRTVLCNSVFASMVGKKPAELYGKTDVENGWSVELIAGNPEKGIQGWGKDDLAALGGATVRAEEEPANAGNEIRWFNTVKLPLRSEEGQIIGLLGMARDITDRVRLQKNLEQERTLLLTLINSIPDLVYAKDREHRFILANSATARFFGYSDVASILGKRDRELLPAEEAEESAADERAVIQQGASLINKEELTRPRPGIPRWFLSTKVPLRDGTGEIRGMVGTGHDITARKQTEEKLRQQSMLLDIASDAIVVRDMHNVIQYWNKSAEKMYGWSAQEAIGRDSVGLLYSAAHAGEAAQADEEVLAQGEWSGEMHHATKAEEELTVEARWTLVRNETGEPAGILAVNTNVSEQRALQAQLLRVQRLESLGTLAGGVAHDLNNVLTPIMMGVEGLSMQNQDEHSRRILEIIQSAAQRGAGIVQQVLSFARGVAGDRAEVQLKHAVREVQNIVQETFPRGIELRGAAAKDLWPVFGDVTQLHQVLMNLCVNARDAMPHGGTLTVSAANVTLDDAAARANVEARPIRYVELTVEDTGVGMAPSLRDKIFDPFFTTKEPGKGTGLGLSTVRTIVKNHGGFVTVESEEGRGSVFRVRIPATVHGEHAAEESSRPRIGKGGGELILVVDDEAAVQDITRQILESYGYRVITAGDGTEAVAQFVDHRRAIRVMITDMMMPFMDGASTIRAVRKIEPDLKIIATSGLVPEGDALEARSMGVQAFLPKPFTAETLLSILQDVLGTGK
jgi:two-component system, cell cycle sensor histidine kinase and response regulator CckA